MIQLGWNTAGGGADLVLQGSGAIAADDGLGTAVILSLFLDGRARADDGAEDRRGWLGDAFAPEDRIGSRLWLLTRERQSEETRRRAEDYAAEALAWLVADGLAADVTVQAEWVARGVLGLAVRIETPRGTETHSFAMRL